MTKELFTHKGYGTRLLGVTVRQALHTLQHVGLVLSCCHHSLQMRQRGGDGSIKSVKDKSKLGEQNRALFLDGEVG